MGEKVNKNDYYRKTLSENPIKKLIKNYFQKDILMNMKCLKFRHELNEGRSESNE